MGGREAARIEKLLIKINKLIQINFEGNMNIKWTQYEVKWCEAQWTEAKYNWKK